MHANEHEQPVTTVTRTRVQIDPVPKVSECFQSSCSNVRLSTGKFTDGYDENYRGDTTDRAWLKTLSEREREAELLKRHEQREIMKRR